jgi:2-polyprenyl-3-methyl-5-hydroxy-6-metoxy-1,4-benzoquinol methylase
MSYSAKVLDEGSLARYYTDTFGSSRHLQGQRVNSLVNLEVLRKLVGMHLRPGANVLDVGTGYGLLLQALQSEFGCDVAGAELSRQEAEHARDELSLDVRPGALAEVGFEHESFDLVLALEVLEHIPEPRAFVAELIPYIRPGGLLVLGTDNFDASIVRRLGAAFPKWIPHTHLSHFNHHTLESLLSTTEGLQFEGGVSYDGWEFYARAAVTSRSRRRAAAQWFDLDATLSTEMGGAFRFFELRRIFNPFWFRLTSRSDLRGAMMYAAARRTNR